MSVENTQRERKGERERERERGKKAFRKMCLSKIGKKDVTNVTLALGADWRAILRRNIDVTLT